MDGDHYSAEAGNSLTMLGLVSPFLTCPRPLRLRSFRARLRPDPQRPAWSLGQECCGLFCDGLCARLLHRHRLLFLCRPPRCARFGRVLWLALSLPALVVGSDGYDRNQPPASFLPCARIPHLGWHRRLCRCALGPRVPRGCDSAVVGLRWRQQCCSGSSANQSINQVACGTYGGIFSLV